MSKRKREAVQKIPLLARPAIGSFLVVASALSFLFLLMILPLVGPAGVVVPHARANFFAFLGLLLFSLLLAVLALLSKMARRKIDGSPLPYWSIGLCAICGLLLVALLSGLLSI